MSRLLGLTTALLFLPATSQGQAPSANQRIEGVWRIAEVTVTGAGASTNSAPQPSLYIFTKNHYSVMFVSAGQPRPALEAYKDAANPTDAERLTRFAHWGPFTANSGTYSVSGTTLTRRPLVAKNESVMTGAPTVTEFRVDGTTLWLISKSAAGQPASETRTRLARIE